MSFLKNFQLEKLDITKACEETPSARLGEEITSIDFIFSSCSYGYLSSVGIS